MDETAEDAAAPIDARAHAARQRAAADGVAAPAEGSGAAGAAHAHDGHEQSRAEEDVAAAAHGDDLCRLVIREEEGDDGHVDVVLIVQLCVTPRSSAHQLEHPLASLVLAVSKELEPTHDDAVAGGGQEAKLEPEQFDALALWVDGVRRRRDPAAGKRQRLLGHRAVVLAIDRRPRVQHQEDVAALSALQGEERLLDWAVLAPPALQVALEEHAHWRATGLCDFCVASVGILEKVCSSQRAFPGPTECPRVTTRKASSCGPGTDRNARRRGQSTRTMLDGRSADQRRPQGCHRQLAASGGIA